MTKHVWVNLYESCELCDLGSHHCHFCGSDLDHETYDTDGNHHTTAFCRPDLVEHPLGELCTYPGDWCYWDHNANKLCEYNQSFDISRKETV